MPGLRERLAAGPVICAEGYLFELERRGYLQAGAFVPEVVLEHPEQVTSLHEQFAHAGSDVVVAFTYYGNRRKLRMLGMEDRLAPMNQQALALARDVADRYGALLAGDVSNTNVYDPSDTATHAEVRTMFDEQVGWAAEANVDYVVAETLRYAGEAELALEAIRAAGLPAVVTLAADRQDTMRDGPSLTETVRRLAGAGADVVGLNCSRGLATMLPLLTSARGAVDVPVAALPVPYRTTPEQPTFHTLADPALPGRDPFPTGLDPFTCTRYEVAEFTVAADAAGVRYLGLCCGAAPHHIRAMAEALGRKPPASRYSEDMSKHDILGTDADVAEQGATSREQH